MAVPIRCADAMTTFVVICKFIRHNLQERRVTAAAQFVHWSTMSTTMFDSNTYGIGELITQRKLFAVPLHQRSYSWGEEQVEQFLDDLNNAFKAGQNDYFIGLMVLQGPKRGVWEVLDGQQRLTTVTMIYSAIRNWLKERGFSDDARQIESEYLGVRPLGGEISTRLRLNSLNHEIFDKHIVRSSPTQELIAGKECFGKKTSNSLLLGAAIYCRNWVENFANSAGEGQEAKAASLFGLSRFLETSVKVVSVDVATDADAYILFEALNNRGADLSALDLVKNYIFSIADQALFPQLELMWNRLVDLIEGSDADDFLKFFWTARSGIIQKTDLFRKIRLTFFGQGAALDLLSGLLNAAEFIDAFDEEDHPMWMSHPGEVIDSILAIKAIGSKQARPVIYSAIKKLDEVSLAKFLTDLVASLVRFQVIGHGRTGVLEKVLGRISPLIWSASVRSRSDWLPILKELDSTDDQFISNFCAHNEQKLARAHYLLKGLESENGHLITTLANSRVIYIPPNYVESTDEQYKKLGSYFILEDDLFISLIKTVKQCPDAEIFDLSKSYFSKSSFFTTSQYSGFQRWDSINADLRTHRLADIAVRHWKIN